MILYFPPQMPNAGPGAAPPVSGGRSCFVHGGIALKRPPERMARSGAPAGRKPHRATGRPIPPAPIYRSIPRNRTGLGGLQEHANANPTLKPIQPYLYQVTNFRLQKVQ